MKGKTCMVTGATSGIGLATAEALARLKATVIVVGRDPERTQTTVDRLRAETANPQIDSLHADLSIQDDIRRLVRAFNGRYSRLDVLVNNAGAIFMRRRLSAEGIELTWATNYLSCFLLTNLLLDRLKASSPARIVNVSSDMQKKAHLHLDDVELKNGYSGFKAYGQSKLAIIIFTYELARRLQGTGVTVNAVHPGWAGSDIGKNNGPLGKLFVPLLKLFAPSPAKAAETSIFLASSPEVESVTGKYFARKRPIPSAPVSYDEAVAKRLWDISEHMTGLAHPL